MRAMRHALCGMLLLLALLPLALSVVAAPEPMTRGQIIDLSKQAVGFSYWWGHGCWNTDGADLGSCSGSCPSCTHTGSYGADCSGLAAKVWQIPSPSPVTTNKHPYSTSNFRNDTTHWSQISWDAAGQADAFVYNTNGSGHIFIYDSGDPWGQVWAYECKGCSYGCVHDLRSVSSSYIAIRRNALQEDVVTGKMGGTLFVDHGQGTADLSEPLADATVTASDQASTTTSATGLWSFTLPPGTYTFSATVTGYLPGSRSCTVTAGGDDSCSFGLVKECAPDCSGRQCGPDPVCQTSCGDCPSDQPCTAEGQCAACVPNCAGRQCGPDPACQTDCGGCPLGQACTTEGQCGACVPTCVGLECGRDPACGTSCGICAPELACDSGGQCQPIDSACGKLYGYTVIKATDPGKTDLHDAERVAPATVTIEGGDSTATDEDGYFEILVIPGTYRLTARAAGYADGTADCSVSAGGYAECYLALSPAHRDGGPDEPRVNGGCGCATPDGSWTLASLALLITGLLLGRRRPV